MSVHWGGRGPGHVSRRTKKVGGSLPPYAFPAAAMDIGMGLADLTSYSGSPPFANIMWSADVWVQVQGSGDWSYSFNGLSATVPTDRFAANLYEGGSPVYDAVPHGTYTVLNPNACKIGIGDANGANIVNYTQSTQFTFDYSGDRLLRLYCEGNCTGVKVIMPGHLSSYLLGDIFNADWIAWHQALGYKTARFMDWLSSYQEISTSWAERPTMAAMTLRDPTTKNMSRAPYEACIAFCNRLDKNFWLNAPHRATDACLTSLATLTRDTLKPTLRVFIEPIGNEVWNYSGGYASQTSWVTYLNNTLYEAVPNGSDGYTHVGHGMTNGQQIVDFATKENYVKHPSPEVYPNGFGVVRTAEVINANEFRIRTGGLGGTINAPAAGIAKIQYKRVNGSEDLSINYGLRAKQVWDIFDGILGRNRCVHIMATQAAVTAHTTKRLQDPAVFAATDAVATAFYYDGDWGLACLDIASGQVTPKAWAFRQDCSYRIAIYANGSTPTEAEILSGSGTGYIAHRDITIPTTGLHVWTSASAITGLTNGTTYRWERIFTETDGEAGTTDAKLKRWRESGTFVASATPSTLPMPCSNAKMAMRARRSTNKWMASAIAQKAVIGGKPIINYEDNSDYHGNNMPLAEVSQWRKDFARSAEGIAALIHLKRSLAANDYKFSAHFGDLNALTPGRFDLGGSIYDGTDPRPAAFAALGGQVAKQTQLAVSDITAANVATEPSSYPHVVHTFANASLSYSIMTGNLDGNFAIVGNELRMVNGIGIDWGTPIARSLKLEVSDGNTTAYPTISFATGDAWYEADALFAWSAVEDTDPVAIDPVKGGQLPQTHGASPAVWASNALTFDGTKGYGSSTGMTAGIPVNTPFLLAVCIDKNSNTSAGKVHAVFGISNVLQLDQDYSGATRLKFNGYNGSSGVADIYTTTAATPTGKHVHWFYYDADPVTPRYYAGMDQTENTAGAVTRTLTSNMVRNLYIGRDATGTIFSLAKLAAVQVVSRSGLTKADALAIVAKMEAHV